MRKLSIACSLLLLQNLLAGLIAPAAFADPVNVDLTSTARSVPGSMLGGTGTVAIRTPQGVSVINRDSLLTPAQFVAANQVLSTGRQTLLLGTEGQAAGGRFSSLPDINNLVIPNGVTLLQNISSGNVNLSGILINSGNVYAYSTNNALLTATISAANIHNTTQGLIATVVPSTVLAQAGVSNVVKNLALNLDVLGEVRNEGRIIGDGALSINAPKVVNSGTIASANSNVNFTSQDHIAIDNTHGSISAPNGDINFRSPEFSAKKDITVFGGTLQAQNVNFNSGDGHLRVGVEQIDGPVNITAGTSVVSTNGGNLHLTKVDLTGDPAFYNTQGDVTISTDLDFANSDLTVIASRNVIMSGAHFINTGGVTGGEINIIAGANFSSNGPIQGSDDTTSTLTVLGPSRTGGRIDLSSMDSKSFSSSGTTSSGDIRLAAFGGAASSAGIINIDSGTTINATSGTAGGSGSVEIFAARDASLGGITVSDGGNVTIANGTAQVLPNTQYLNGTRISGGLIAPATPANAVTTVGNITNTGGPTATGDITIRTGASASVGNITAGTGNVDIYIDGGSAALNMSGKTISGFGKISLEAPVGTLNIATVESGGAGAIAIKSISTNITTVQALGSGDINIKRGSTFGSIESQSGSINIENPLGSILVSNHVTTEGGNVWVNVRDNFTVGATGGYIVAGDGTNNGQVSIRAANVSITGPGLTAQLGGESGPIVHSLYGSSVFVESSNSGNMLKPVVADTGLTYTSGGNITIAHQIVQSRAVDFDDSGAPIVGATTSGADFVRVSNGSLAGGSSPVVDTTAVSGPGGMIILLAGLQYDKVTSPGLLIAHNATSGNGGDVNLAGWQLVTDGGSKVLVGSRSGAGLANVHGVNLGDISATDGGHVSIFSTFPAGSGSFIALDGTGITVGGGGAISLATGVLSNLNSTSPFLLDASDTTGKGGGTIEIEHYAANTIDIGIAPQQFQIDASSSTANGGSFKFTAFNTGVTLAINGAALNVSTGGTNTDGGSITVLNRSGGTTSISGGLSANGSHNGGSIEISSGINGGAYNLSITGALSADGFAGNGGTIFVSAGGATGSTTLDVVDYHADGLQGNGGAVTLQNLGTVTLFSPPAVLSARSQLEGKGGSILLDLSSSTAAVNVGSEWMLDVRGGNAVGSAGAVDIRGGGDVFVDTNGLQLTPGGGSGNGDGATVSISTSNGLVDLSGSNLNLSGSAIGNGGTLNIEQLATNGSGVNINTGIIADGGAIQGDGGTINMLILDSFSISGLNHLSGQGVGPIAFGPAAFVSASAPTAGNGGTVRIWGERFDIDPSINMSIAASANNNLTPSAGGVDSSAGTILLATSGNTADINVSSSNGAFSLNAGGVGIGLARVDGGTVQLFTRNGGDINVDPAQLNVKGANGSGGTIDLISVHDGDFFFDDYAGTVRLLNSSSTLDLTGSGTGGGGTLRIGANSLKPIVLESQIDTSNNSSAEGAGKIYISNLAPGGIQVNGTNITGNNPSGVALLLNISTSHIEIDPASNFSIVANGLGTSNSSTLVIGTTDPGASGSLSIGTSAGDISITTNGHAVVKVMAGGDLNVDTAGLVYGPSSRLLLSAGVVSESVSFNDGIPQLLNVNRVNSTLLNTQFGSLNINGPLDVSGLTAFQGGNVALVSNSQNVFDVGGSSISGIAGSINVSAGPTGQFNGNAIVANYGSGGVRVRNGSIINGAGSTAGGASVTPGAIERNALPIGYSDVDLQGVIEVFSPVGDVQLDGNLSSVGSASGAASNAGGNIYVAGQHINTTGTISLDAHSNYGAGGQVFVTSLADDADLDISSSGIIADVRPNVVGNNNFRGGKVSITAGGALSVDVATGLFTNLSAGSTGNGAGFELIANKGALFISGSINASAGTGGGGQPGTIVLKSAGNSPFLIGGATDNGITGTLSNLNGASNPTGSITIGGVSNSNPFDVQINNSVASTTGINISSNTALNLTVNPSGTLSGPVSATSAGDMAINVQPAGMGLQLSKAIAYSGAVNVVVNGGTLAVLSGATVAAENGSLTLQNTDTVSPTAAIIIGAGALVSASGPSNPVLNIAIGPVPTIPTGSVSSFGNTPVTKIDGGDVFVMGPVTGPASGSNFIVAGKSNVVFSNQGAGLLTVSGGNTRIQSVTFDSLDLTDASNSSYIQALQGLNAQVLGGSYNGTTGNIIIPQHISTRALTGLNIPAGVTVEVKDTNLYTPIAVTTPNASIPATVNGVLRFTGSPTGTYLLIDSQVGSSSLVMGVNSAIRNSIPSPPRPDITIIVDKLTMAGNATIEVDDSTTSGTLNLILGSENSTIGRLTANRVFVQLDGTGSLLQAAGGLVKANDVNLDLNTGTIGTSSAPLNLTIGNASGRIFSLTTFRDSGCTNCGTYLNVTDSNHSMPLTLVTEDQNGMGDAFALTSQVSVGVNGSAIETGSATITSTEGYIGTANQPLLMNTSLLQLMAPSTSGIVSVANFGTNSILLDSVAGAGFTYTLTESATINSVDVKSGDLVINGADVLAIAPDSVLVAENGNVAISDANYNPGSGIFVGRNAFIGAFGDDSASVLISFDGGVGFTNQTDPANVQSILSNGGLSYFGDDGITAIPPGSMVFASGPSSVVAFDTNLQGQNRIVLESNVTVTAAADLSTPLQLTSLDLTDPAVLAQINDLKDVGVIGGYGSSTDFSLRPFNLASSLTALNIPLGNSVQLSGFSDSTPISVNLTGTSTTPSAQIDGAVSIANGSSLNLGILSTNAALYLSVTGTISGGDNITITASSMDLNGSQLFTGNALTLNADNLTLTGGALGGANIVIHNSSSLTMTSSDPTMSTFVYSNGTIINSDTSNVTITGANFAMQGPLRIAAPIG